MHGRASFRKKNLMVYPMFQKVAIRTLTVLVASLDFALTSNKIYTCFTNNIRILYFNLNAKKWNNQNLRYYI